jgi:hypothetical protein
MKGATHMHDVTTPLARAYPATARYRVTMSGSELVTLLEALERAPEPWRDAELAATLQQAMHDRNAADRVGS